MTFMPMVYENLLPDQWRDCYWVHNVLPASRYHTSATHTVLAALIRWVQLPQLVLSYFPHQCVERILHSLQAHTNRITEKWRLLSWENQGTTYVSFITSSRCAHHLIKLPWQPLHHFIAKLWSMLNLWVENVSDKESKGSSRNVEVYKYLENNVWQWVTDSGSFAATEPKKAL